MSEIVSVSTTNEIISLLKAHHISKSEAFRVGAAMLLAERGVDQYLNRTTIGRKLIWLNEKLDIQQKKLEEYENVLEKGK